MSARRLRVGENTNAIPVLNLVARAGDSASELRRKHRRIRTIAMSLSLRTRRPTSVCLAA
jgi:hypothetical protein